MTEGQCQIFIEAPYRNIKLMQTMLATLSPRCILTIACDITSPAESISTRSVEEWRRTSLPDMAKRPTIFILGI